MRCKRRYNSSKMNERSVKLSAEGRIRKLEFSPELFVQFFKGGVPVMIGITQNALPDDTEFCYSQFHAGVGHVALIIASDTFQPVKASEIQNPPSVPCPLMTIIRKPEKLAA